MTVSLLRQYGPYSLMLLLLLLAYVGAAATIVRWDAGLPPLFYSSAIFGTALLLLNGYVFYRQAKSSRAMTAFLIRINHNIRTPLSAISGIGEIFDAQTTLDDKQRLLVKTLVSSTEELKVLTDDILKFSGRLL